MKIAFTTSGDSMEAPLEPRFGRAEGFLIYDTNAETFETHSNRTNLNATQGAGIQAAQKLSTLGVDCLVTGHCGPKAFGVLNTAGIRVYTSSLPTVADALRAITEGSLKPSAAADVDSHWT